MCCLPRLSPARVAGTRLRSATTGRSASSKRCARNASSISPPPRCTRRCSTRAATCAPSFEDSDDPVEGVCRLRDAGARNVAVTRAAEGLVAVIDDALVEVRSPTLEVVDHRGAGDAFTAPCGGVGGVGPGLGRCRAVGRIGGNALRDPSRPGHARPARDPPAPRPHRRRAASLNRRFRRPRHPVAGRDRDPRPRRRPVDQRRSARRAAARAAPSRGTGR